MSTAQEKLQVVLQQAQVQQQAQVLMPVVGEAGEVVWQEEQEEHIAVVVLGMVVDMIGSVVVSKCLIQLAFLPFFFPCRASFASVLAL